MNILGAGLVTIDIIEEVFEDWRPTGTAPVYASGGTVCNILCHLAHAGLSTHIVGTFGPDDLGVTLKTDLEAFGIDCSSLLCSDRIQTRRILHKIVVRGSQLGRHRFEMACSACHQRFPPVPPPTLSMVAPTLEGMNNKNTLLIVDRANELTVSLVQKVATEGGVVIFEPGYLPSKDHAALWEILRHVDVLKYSAELTWQSRPFSKAIEGSPEASRAKLIIETHGPGGVHVTRRNTKRRLVAQPIREVRDTSGAGDAFMAGFILGLGVSNIEHLDTLEDSIIESAIERGQARGALACMFRGSKGILYKYSHADIEAAVTEFVQKLAPPKDFGAEELLGSIGYDSSIHRSLCPVCHLARGG